MNEVIEKSLVEEIIKLARRIRRFTAHSDRHLSRLDTLKLMLLENPGINLRDLARRMDIRPPSLSEWLDKLLEEGLVTKERDEKDKRAIQLFLTPAGQDQAKQLRKRGESPDFLSEFLTSEEKEEFFKLCQKLNDGMDEKRKQRHKDRKSGKTKSRKHHSKHRKPRERTLPKKDQGSTNESVEAEKEGESL